MLFSHDLSINLHLECNFRYYNKKESADAILGHSKKQYCEQRNLIWNVINKRPHKLKEKLRELEDYLVHNKIVYFAWEDERLKLLLSTGLIVNLTTNSNTGDIVSIYFDKHLSAKLQVNIICDGRLLAFLYNLMVFNLPRQSCRSYNWKSSYLYLQ